MELFNYDYYAYFYFMVNALVISWLWKFKATKKMWEQLKELTEVT